MFVVIIIDQTTILNDIDNDDALLAIDIDINVNNDEVSIFKNNESNNRYINLFIGIIILFDKIEPIISTDMIYTNVYIVLTMILVIRLDKYILVLLWPIIILFFSTPSEYSVPINKQINIGNRMFINGEYPKNTSPSALEQLTQVSGSVLL